MFDMMRGVDSLDNSAKCRTQAQDSVGRGGRIQKKNRKNRDEIRKNTEKYRCRGKSGKILENREKFAEMGEK